MAFSLLSVSDNNDDGSGDDDDEEEDVDDDDDDDDDDEAYNTPISNRRKQCKAWVRTGKWKKGN